jgi:hypothetical protein
MLLQQNPAFGPVELRKQTEVFVAKSNEVRIDEEMLVNILLNCIFLALLHLEDYVLPVRAGRWRRGVGCL